MAIQARTFEQIVAIGKESTFGTPVSPTFAMPITNFEATDQIEANLAQGRRGVPSVTFGSVAGTGHCEFTLEGECYPAAIGHLLFGILGADSVSGSEAPYTHSFSNAATPPSYTIVERVINANSGSRRIAGARFGQLTFSWNAGEGVIAYNLTGMGLMTESVNADGTAVTAETPWPGWRQAVTSSGLDDLVAGGEIAITRELQVVHTGEDNRSPRHINVGPTQVNGNLLVAVEANLAVYDMFRASTRQSLNILFDDATASRSIGFQMTDCLLTAAPAEIDRGGVSVFLRLNFEGIHNSTDAGPIEVEVENSVASY
ncbi:MAG: phage tail tube protein [Porticoccaceae bacterium]|nr:phage tail tube protein [Porticoccaceae bacterium]